MKFRKISLKGLFFINENRAFIDIKSGGVGGFFKIRYDLGDQAVLYLFNTNISRGL